MEYNEDIPRKKLPVLCWGHKRLRLQKGITVFTLSSNSQNPLAGAAYNAVFNTARRIRAQFLYVAPPLIVAFLLLDWAEKRNKFLNSREGRRLADEDGKLK